MYDEKNIEETTWGAIGWSALRGFLIASVVAAPIVWLALENKETIRSWIAGLTEHLPDN